MAFGDSGSVSSPFQNIPSVNVNLGGTNYDSGISAGTSSTPGPVDNMAPGVGGGISVGAPSYQQVSGLGASAGAGATPGTPPAPGAPTAPTTPSDPFSALISAISPNQAIANRQLDQQQQYLNEVINNQMPFVRDLQKQLSEATMTGQWDKVPTLQAKLQEANIALANNQQQMNDIIAQSQMSGMYGGMPTLQAQELMNQYAQMSGNQGLQAGQSAGNLALGLVQTQAQLAQSPLVAWYTARGLPPPQSAVMSNQSANIDALERKLIDYQPTQNAWNFSNSPGPLPTLAGAPNQVPGAPTQPQPISMAQNLMDPSGTDFQHAYDTLVNDYSKGTSAQWRAGGEAASTARNFGVPISVAEDAIKTWEALPANDQRRASPDQVMWALQQAIGRFNAQPQSVTPNPLPQQNVPSQPTWSGNMPSNTVGGAPAPGSSTQMGGQLAAMGRSVPLGPGGAGSADSWATSGAGTPAGFSVGGQWIQPPGQTTIQGEYGGPMQSQVAMMTPESRASYQSDLAASGLTPEQFLERARQQQGSQPPVGGGLSSGMSQQLSDWTQQHSQPPSAPYGGSPSAMPQMQLNTSDAAIDAVRRFNIPVPQGNMLRGGPIQQGADQRSGPGNVIDFQQTTPGVYAMAPTRSSETQSTVTPASPMSTGPAPWADALNNNTSLLPFQAGGPLNLPAIQQWNNMTVPEQQATMSTFQSVNGVDPQTFLRWMQASSPQWGPMNQAKYRAA